MEHCWFDITIAEIKPIKRARKTLNTFYSYDSFIH